MQAIDKVLYTAKTHTTGGRDGASRTSDGRLDVKLSTPGTPGAGTNPEQLTLSHFGLPIHCRSHFCVNGGTNVLIGSDCMHPHGVLPNNASTKRDLSIAFRNGSMQAWVLATCGGPLCARKSNIVCCNSTEPVMTLTRLF